MALRETEGSGKSEPRNEASQLGIAYCLGGGFDSLCDSHLCPHVSATWVQEKIYYESNGGDRERLR